LSPKQGVAVVFYFGALGGWNDLTQIAVSKVSALPWSRSRCLKTAKIPELLIFLRDTSLGTSRYALVQQLGLPSRTSPYAIHYYVAHSCTKIENRESHTAEDCVEVSMVDAKFDEDGLSFIQFGQFVDQ
jgi:hypothetical protein